jgi:hypothetical protein
MVTWQFCCVTVSLSQRGCPYSSCWPIALRRTTPPAWRLLIWFSGENFAYPVTCCSGLLQIRNSQQRTMSPIWWSDYTTPTHPGDTWGWPAGRGRSPKLQSAWSSPGLTTSSSEFRGTHTRSRNSGTPGQTGAVPGGCSGRAALRRRQCHIRFLGEHDLWYPLLRLLPLLRASWKRFVCIWVTVAGKFALTLLGFRSCCGGEGYLGP